MQDRRDLCCSLYTTDIKPWPLCALHTGLSAARRSVRTTKPDRNITSYFKKSRAALNCSTREIKFMSSTTIHKTNLIIATIGSARASDGESVLISQAGAKTDAWSKLP